MKIANHLAILCWLIPLVVTTATSRTHAEIAAGQWLIDYGRAHGYAATDPQPADAEFILVWLDAATEVSPDLWEAYRWRYDLLARLNREEEAVENLKRYCQEKPNDAPALLTWFNTEFAQRQKIEDRIELCRTFLARPQVPSEVASDIQLQLAALHEGQGDRNLALTQTRKAIDIAPHNMSAHILLAELEERATQAETQVDLLLKSIAIDPVSPQRHWELAGYLKQMGMYDEALQWLKIASKNWTRATGGQPPSPGLTTEIAEIQLQKGDPATAISTAQNALSVDPKYAPASFVIIRAAKKLGRTELADSESSKLTNRFREWETNPHRANAVTCATIAEYFLNIQIDPQRAVRYAELAVQKDSVNPAYRAMLGQSYGAANLNTEAIQSFNLLATLDARSAVAFAKAQNATGNQTAAIETLKSAASRPNEHRDEIERELDALNALVPPTPDLTPIRSHLSAFDKFPLTFAANPSQFIEFDVQLNTNVCEFGETASATLTLKNKGNMDIVLGTNRMLNPQVTVSLLTDSRLDPTLENYLMIDFPGETILKPGETRSVEQSLAQTGGHVFLTSQPQRRIDLTARFILDPIANENGNVVSRLPGMKPVDATFIRTPVDATDEGLSKLRKQLVATEPSERLVANETFVALVIERFDSMQRKPQTYHAVPIDLDKISDDTLATLRDPNPFVRARSLAIQTRLPIHPDAIQAATPLISDPHWLPRLLAVEYFAKKQGPVFLPVLERLSEDPHPIVARLASLYREQAKSLGPARR